MQHPLSMTLLILLEDREGSILEERFNREMHDQNLVPLISIIEGLMKYLPSSRITASQALGLLGRKSEGEKLGGKSWLGYNRGSLDCEKRGFSHKVESSGSTNSVACVTS